EGHGTGSVNNPVPASGEHASGSDEGLGLATWLVLRSQTWAGSFVEAGTVVTIVVTETNIGNSALTGVSVSDGGVYASFNDGATRSEERRVGKESSTWTAPAGANTR